MDGRGSATVCLCSNERKFLLKTGSSLNHTTPDSTAVREILNTVRFKRHHTIIHELIHHQRRLFCDIYKGTYDAGRNSNRDGVRWQIGNNQCPRSDLTTIA